MPKWEGLQANLTGLLGRGGAAGVPRVHGPQRVSMRGCWLQPPSPVSLQGHPEEQPVRCRQQDSERLVTQPHACAVTTTECGLQGWHEPASELTATVPRLPGPPGRTICT